MENSKSPQQSRMSWMMSSDVDGDNDEFSAESASNQTAVKPETGDRGQDEHGENRSPSLHNSAPSNVPNRVSPSIGAFTVQCATCFKWRLIPSKEIYEEIRERILQEPFVCERAREWRPNVTCDDPEDISQDGTRLWAIDKPNIAQPPPGWERQIRIRGEGGTKFADVYYTSPTGKKLRSMVEIERYLSENPDYVAQGVSLAQFSFQIPKPLGHTYVKKRTRTSDGASTVSTNSVQPEAVNPISWAAPAQEEIELSQQVEIELSQQASLDDEKLDSVEVNLTRKRRAGSPQSGEVHSNHAPDEPKI